MSAILAADAWPTNAELIAAVHALGYLRDDDHILDPTYENGLWWKAWRPEKLTTHHRAKDGTDFRALPYPDGTFDAIAYDPPYVCPGGRKTSTIQEHARPVRHERRRLRRPRLPHPRAAAAAHQRRPHRDVAPRPTLRRPVPRPGPPERRRDREVQGLHLVRPPLPRHPPHPRARPRRSASSWRTASST
jgi:hypothetical protein